MADDALPTDVREQLTRFLRGDGVELGPGHHPFPLGYPGATVRYVDRWDPDENRTLFPELGDAAPFPRPDIVADLDSERLSALADGSQDFVIASHVLEHVVDPLGLLVEIHRVLRPGGVVLILLPDRTRTFDSERSPTTIDHLAAEHAAGVTAVSDEHLDEFLRHTDPGYPTWDDAARAEHFELHRRRSIHVHCWDQHEFVPVLEHSITDLGLEWEMLDATFTEDSTNQIEFGFVLRRPTRSIPVDEQRAHLRRTWDSLHESSRRRREQLARAVAGRDAAEAALARFRSLPGYDLARRASARVRGSRSST